MKPDNEFDKNGNPRAYSFFNIHSKDYFLSQIKKIEHWKKIAIHATEQCGRLRLMHTHSPRTYSSLLSKQISSSKFLLHQDGEKFNTSELESDDISIFVGPEGGFDSSEIESFKINGWKMRTINVNILRTETACISALSLINNYDIFSRHSL